MSFYLLFSIYLEIQSNRVSVVKQSKIMDQERLGQKQQGAESELKKVQDKLDELESELKTTRAKLDKAAHELLTVESEEKEAKLQKFVAIQLKFFDDLQKRWDAYFAEKVYLRGLLRPSPGKINS